MLIFREISSSPSSNNFFRDSSRRNCIISGICIWYKNIEWLLFPSTFFYFFLLDTLLNAQGIIFFKFLLTPLFFFEGYFLGLVMDPFFWCVFLLKDFLIARGIIFFKIYVNPIIFKLFTKYPFIEGLFGFFFVYFFLKALLNARKIIFFKFLSIPLFFFFERPIFLGSL